MTDSTSSSARSDGTTSWELLDRYLAGECTPEETRIVERMIAAVSDGPTLVLELRRGLRGEGAQAFEATERLAELRMKMREDGGEAASVQVRVQAGWRGMVTLARPVVGKQTLRRWTLSAGLVACLAFIAVFLVHRPALDFGTTRTYATAVGQRATLLLNDGTHVMLAPQTTIRLAGFGRSSRTILLDGDAYFEVAPSARIPFIVKTGSTMTRVLGTAFAVQHYSGDAEVRVAVATGKVIVSSGTQYSAVTVTAGHMVSVTDSTQMVKAVDNIDTEIGWLGDRLVFQYVPVPKVLATLTRWYGYQFRYTDSTVMQQNVTIALSMRSSAEALASLEKILDVSLEVVGDTVTLTPVHSRMAPRQRAKHYDIWVPTREVGR